MNWILFAWAVMAGACSAVASIHLAVWLRRRAQYSSLLIAVSALAVAVIAVFEMMLMGAASPRGYAALVRWGQVPVFVLVMAVMAFVRVHFAAGRLWLAYAVFGISALLLAINFTSDLGIRFAEIPVLERLDVIGGATVTIAYGAPTSWQSWGSLRLLLYLAYVVDASLALWRRGGPEARRRAVLVGGAIVLATVLAGSHGALIHHDFIRSPYLVTPACLIFIAAMGYDASETLFRAREVAEQAAVNARLLQESVQRIELAANAVELGFWEWHVRDRHVWANEQCRRMLGFAGSVPVTFRGILSRTHPADRQQLRRAVARALMERGSFLLDFRIRSSDESTRWVSAHGQAGTDDAGRLSVLRGVSRDITRRVQAEAQLHRVVEASPNAILVVDEEGNVLLANRRAAEMFRREHGELLRRPIERLLHDPHGGGRALLPRRSVGRHDADQSEAGISLHGVRKDGSQFPVEVWVTPLETQRGAHTLITVMDITTRRLAENEAAARRNELMHLSRVALIGELSAALAHELNQPLAAILSNAQAAKRFLERDPDNVGEVREILTDIIDADRRAGEVISRLRTMLRKDAGGRDRVDLNDVVGETLRLMRSDFLNRHVVVRADMAPALPHVMADRVQLQQILVNLLMNACDAMSDLPQEERVVKLTTSLRDDGFVEVGVADQGHGIPAEQLEAIFEPFMTTKAHGMGVGLSVCRAIMRAHGGSIRAFNNASRGATFRCSVPVSRETSA